MSFLMPVVTNITDSYAFVVLEFCNDYLAYQIGHWQWLCADV